MDAKHDSFDLFPSNRIKQEIRKKVLFDGLQVQAASDDDIVQYFPMSSGWKNQ